MALDVPWQLFAEARQRRDDKARQDIEALQGTGQTIGNTLQAFGQRHQQAQQAAQWQKTINEMMNNPNISPQAKAMLPVLIQHPELANNLLPKAFPKGGNTPEMEIGPDGSISISGMPLGGSPSPVPPTPTGIAGIGGMTSPGGMPPQPPPRPPVRIPVTGNKAADLITKGVGGKPNPKDDLRKQFIAAMNKRTEVLGQKNQFGQIDRLAKATGIQPQLLKQIQTNNVRADRALSILSEGTIYPQKLNLALVDLAGIMQGGSPQLTELHNTMFPTVQQTVAQARLYLTGNPNTPIPKQVVDEVKRLVQGLKEVDNNYIRQNSQFQTGMLGPTIQGFQKNVAPVVQQGTENFIKGGTGQGQQDPLGIR